MHNLVLWREHLDWLEAERDGGPRRAGRRHALAGVGASPELAEALRTGRFEQVQLPYNPLERDCEQELLPLAASSASR